MGHIKTIVSWVWPKILKDQCWKHGNCYFSALCFCWYFSISNVIFKGCVKLLAAFEKVISSLRSYPGDLLAKLCLSAVYMRSTKISSLLATTTITIGLWNVNVMNDISWLEFEKMFLTLASVIYHVSYSSLLSGRCDKHDFLSLSKPLTFQ